MPRMPSTSRNLAQYLPAVTLGQAAGHDQGSTAPLLLEAGQLEDRLHRLRPRSIDEGTGVDDEAIGVLGALGREKARGREQAEHQLGIDLILRTAEGGEVDPHFYGLR